MLRVVALALVLVACSGAPASVTAPTPTLPDAALATPATPHPAPSVDAGMPDVETAVGAMPVPDEEHVWPIEQIDTTVAASALPLASGRWATRKRMRIGCAIGDTLWISDFDPEAGRGELQLMLTNADFEDPGLGRQKHVSLGTVALSGDGFDGLLGDAFPPREYGERDGVARGPIRYAIRIARPGHAGLRQIVVYQEGSALLVVERPLGTAGWSRRLRIDLVCAPTFEYHSIWNPH